MFVVLTASRSKHGSEKLWTQIISHFYLPAAASVMVWEQMVSPYILEKCVSHGNLCYRRDIFLFLHFSLGLFPSFSKFSIESMLTKCYHVDYTSLYIVLSPTLIVFSSRRLKDFFSLIISLLDCVWICYICLSLLDIYVSHPPLLPLNKCIPIQLGRKYRIFSLSYVHQVSKMLSTWICFQQCCYNHSNSLEEHLIIFAL